MKKISPESQIYNRIIEWSQEADILVVGIDGYSGAGKTTLANSLAHNHQDLYIIHMDDFVGTANTKEVLLPYLENNNDLELHCKPADGLSKLQTYIKDFKYQKIPMILVVEGIFLLHEEVLRTYLDKIIYIDCDKHKADERRVAREKQRWGEKYFPEDHPDYYARLFKIAYERYEELYVPIENSDMVIKLF
jgi:uridine kinase